MERVPGPRWRRVVTFLSVSKSPSYSSLFATEIRWTNIFDVKAMQTPKPWMISMSRVAQILSIIMNSVSFACGQLILQARCLV